jgi:stalled ribosome rescue protein Dom34
MVRVIAREEPMTHHHAVVWLDHHEARVFAFNPDQTDRTVLHAHGQKGDNLRHNKGHLMGRKSPPDREFLHAIVDAVKDAPEILVVGPGSAKLELVKYVHEAAPRLADQIVGVETMDHPTDNQVVAHARAYFLRADRMLPQR